MKFNTVAFVLLIFKLTLDKVLNEHRDITSVHNDPLTQNLSTHIASPTGKNNQFMATGDYSKMDNNILAKHSFDLNKNFSLAKNIKS